MAGQSRKWMILVATIWIQAFTGTNFDFSAYSSELKSVLGISQVQLNYLAVASDLGKVFGWSSGLALMYFPIWTVLFAAAFMGFVGYGVQWLVITNFISLPYIMVFLCCLLAGLSICWFNTVCFVLCISNFPANRSLALSLTVSFNGVSAALYTLAYNAINPTSPELYLLLNALIPLVISFTAIIPILRQPPFEPLPPDGVRRDSLMFLLLNILAALNGVYLLLFESKSSDLTSARLLFGGAILLLVLPLCIPGLVIARSWYHRTIHTSFRLEGSGFILVDPDELELHKGMLAHEASRESYQLLDDDVVSNPVKTIPVEEEGDADESSCCKKLVTRGQLELLGIEHSLWQLLSRADFWFYYIAYFCGGTIGLVYSNNLGQIAQSLGQSSNTTTLVTLYSSFSFFGRLLSATPDYIRAKVYFARTGWLAIALLPTPIALFLLASSGTASALQVGTALMGLSSGFIFAAAVSITSELFGPNSVGVNHNILITNIPIGSLIYGFLAALVYDSHGSTGTKTMTDSVVCMGRGCYYLTFVWWGCLSVLGLGSSLVLFIRTRRAYQRFEQARISSNIDS
ncbi:Major facilitator superfamily protein [Raphanus sativus]|uniref:Protein NUCLEAR FUSION DEFECTIVE 4 n=1 Tax=Raphanus sativus TaxID=3726 RepID=A0A6J0KZD0_RAPSA|nr:protein NUCLEAR FUSION DEFECTIVE 4 [Raphanus sativus]KAJ4899888.1 Major facilitator superfamily protein [Raphanus sativus]